MRSSALCILMLAPGLAIGSGCNGEEFAAEPASNTTGGGGGSDASGHDVIVADQSWPNDSPADQGTGDAAPDVSVDPPCVGTGFHLEPAVPKSPSFDVLYENTQGLVCVDFRVTCSNGPATITGKPQPTDCPDLEFCWATSVSNCGPGTVTLEFIHDKDVGNPGDYCHDTFTGSPGQVAASCTFDI